MVLILLHFQIPVYIHLLAKHHERYEASQKDRPLYNLTAHILSSSPLYSSGQNRKTSLNRPMEKTSGHSVATKLSAYSFSSAELDDRRFAAVSTRKTASSLHKIRRKCRHIGSCRRECRTQSALSRSQFLGYGGWMIRGCKH